MLLYSHNYPAGGVQTFKFTFEEAKLAYDTTITCGKFPDSLSIQRVLQPASTVAAIKGAASKD